MDTCFAFVFILQYFMVNCRDNPSNSNPDSDTSEASFIGENNNARNSPNSFKSVHYALDPRKTHELALWEENLAEMLSKIHNNMSYSIEAGLCYSYLGKYLQEFHFGVDTSIRGKQRAIMILENPNLALRMIRRIVFLIDDANKVCQNSVPDAEQAISEVFGKRLEPPTKQDLDDALLGLLRIHYIYMLNATNEIRLGIFNGIKTGARLLYEDCLALANKAISINAEVLAYQWLMSAYLSMSDVGTPQAHHMNKTCAGTSECLDPSIQNIEHLENTVAMVARLSGSESLEELHQKFRNKQQTYMKNRYFHNTSIYATCRGESTMSIENQSKLFCFYKTSNPYFYISPIKTEVLSNDPLILQFYEFVGNQTIDFVLKEASKSMSRSGVISLQKPEMEFIDSRTSINGWIYDTENYNPHKILANLSKRIEKLIGLEVYKQKASVFQVVSYGSLGGHYDFHHDSIRLDAMKTIENGGDRIATLLLVLSDVKMGGYTAFPTAGVFAKPVNGSAIFWYNVKRNGMKDPRLAHGGCPVILGNKKVANRWILQYENMWKHPCLTDPLL